MYIHSHSDWSLWYSITDNIHTSRSSLKRLYIQYHLYEQGQAVTWTLRWHSQALNPGPPFQSWQFLLFKIYLEGQLLINSLLSILLSAVNFPKKSFSIPKFSSGTSITSRSHNSIFTINNFCIHTLNCAWTEYQGRQGVDKTLVKNQWNSAYIKLSQNYSLKNKTQGGTLKVTWHITESENQ